MASGSILYELWDGDTGNRVGAYRTEAAALRDVADTMRRYGADSPEAQSLGLVGPPGTATVSGAELLERARRSRAA